MKTRYSVELSYNGKGFHGWQIQPNAETVQEYLERCFSQLLKEEIKLTGAGRTDTGVHASYFVAHFNTAKPFDPERLEFRLNRFLNSGVSILKIRQQSKDFHSRFSATSRTYKYVLSSRKPVYFDMLVHYISENLDIAAMQKASDYLKTIRDFTSFAKLHSDSKSNTCTISNATWMERDEFLVFNIKADRFLRNMVRSITGTLIDLGRKKIDEAEFKRIIHSKNNQMASPSAPGHALYLADVEYPEEFGLCNLSKNSFLPFINQE